ncbi:MAG: hypothetical protein FJW35_18330, partial [Acidobacteria bacterium]|nr:hypothetical protein [Acidobacteriota bacterium]
MRWLGTAAMLLSILYHEAPPQGSAPTFGDDLAFLGKHVEVVVLSDETGAAQVAVAPAYQCRVMRSTADGAGGISYGWVNRELIASGRKQPHINVHDGEDRFWIGPEGGQFSVFFRKGDPFDLDHRFTPAAIDTEPFELIAGSAQAAGCRRVVELTNYSGTKFHLEV